jgi:hypothetical protein
MPKKKKKGRTARRIAKGMFGGMGRVAGGGAVGAVAAFAHEKRAEKIDFLQEWYGGPVAMLGVALAFQASKRPALRGASQALAGAGGAVGYINYKLHKASEDAKQPAETTGLYGRDAGVLQSPRAVDGEFEVDTGVLQDPRRAA